MEAEITKEKLQKYFEITGRALRAAKEAFDESTSERIAQAIDFHDMASRYFSDAEHFERRGDWVLAFAALNYAHGWLDAGARIKLFLVDDDQLFTVDGPAGGTPRGP